MSAPLFASLKTVQRIEAAEATVLYNYAQAFSEQFPDVGADWLKIGGGIAACNGPDSPLNEVKNFGIGQAVTGEMLDLVEAFFHRRNLPVRLTVCPFTDPSLVELLNQRNYTFADMETMLFRPLTPEKRQEGLSSDFEIRIADDSDRRAWAAILTRCFFGIDQPSDQEMTFAFVSFATRGQIPYIISAGDRPAAAGTLSMNEQTALLAATATLPEYHRGRGIHRIFIEHRLDAVIENGCNLAVYGAQSGTTSHRNAERAGFRIAYNKINYF